MPQTERAGVRFMTDTVKAYFIRIGVVVDINAAEVLSPLRDKSQHTAY